MEEPSHNVAEAERLRHVEIERLLRPVLALTIVLLLVPAALGAALYSREVLLTVLAALVGVALSMAVISRRIAASTTPGRWVVMLGAINSLLIWLVIARTGGFDSPVVPIVALMVTLASARLTGLQLLISLLCCAAAIAGGGLLAWPAPPASSSVTITVWFAVLVSIAGITTRLAHAERTVRGSAILDPLTGLLNRSALQARTAEIESQARLTGLPVAALMCDLDGFKQVNDELGHEAGDRVLQDVAYSMRTSLRSFELIYRLGGDEFVVLLPGSHLNEAEALAEQMRSAVEDLQLAGPVTMSIGVAAAHGRSVELAETIREADEQLYAAKAAGRNCVRSAHQATERDAVAV